VLIAFEPKARRDSADADHKKAVEAAKAQRAQLAAQAAQAAQARAGAGAAAGGGRPKDSTAAARDPAQLVNAQGGQAAPPFRLPVRQPRGPFTPAQIQLAIDSGRLVLLAPVLPTDSVREQVDTANGGVAGYTKQVGSVGGLTALHHAARQGSAAAALALLDGGAKINDTSLVDRMTPLMMAAVNGQFDVALRLVERGADPNLATAYGMSPLYAALNAQWAPKSRYPQPQAIHTQRTSYLELAAALLAKGANPNARLTKQPWWFAYNNCGSFNCGLEVIDGTTPFWRAAYALDVDAMRLLKQHGAVDTLPSIPPRPAARAAAGAARPDSGARRPTVAVAVAAPPAGPPPPAPKDPPAHPSAGASAPAMTPNTVPAPTAPAAVPADQAAARPAAPGAPNTTPNATPNTAPNTAPGTAAAATGPAARGAGSFGDPQFKLDPEVAAAARVAPVGAGVFPVHAAAGVGYGNGFAANAHRAAPDGWMRAMRYLVEELKADVNARDNNGYTPLHHAAARGDNEMIRYLVAKGADVKAVSRTGARWPTWPTGRSSACAPSPRRSSCSRSSAPGTSTTAFPADRATLRLSLPGLRRPVRAARARRGGRAGVPRLRERGAGAAPLPSRRALRCHARRRRPLHPEARRGAGARARQPAGGLRAEPRLTAGAGRRGRPPRQAGRRAARQAGRYLAAAASSRACSSAWWSPASASLVSTRPSASASRPSVSSVASATSWLASDAASAAVAAAWMRRPSATIASARRTVVRAAVPTWPACSAACGAAPGTAAAIPACAATPNAERLTP
jgi:ankyrin repeat protein